MPKHRLVQAYQPSIRRVSADGDDPGGVNHHRLTEGPMTSPPSRRGAACGPDGHRRIDAKWILCNEVRSGCQFTCPLETNPLGTACRLNDAQPWMRTHPRIGMDDEMTTEIAIVFMILGVSVVFLVTEWISMEVTALLVLGAVALTGLVAPNDALAGFSNPAVVTVWAVFILSGGLTRTGVANLIGRVVLRLAGRSETLLVVVIMTCAGAMSAIMNNVAVAALMMPVVMDIARSTGKQASRLLLPLAYGSLLGGLTTQIGTPSTFWSAKPCVKTAWNLSPCSTSRPWA